LKAVNADPENQDARNLCADALEQLGYMAESGTWRNCYLSAAYELRNGNVGTSVHSASSSGDMQKNLTPIMLFDYMGILLDKNAVSSYEYKINVKITDLNENYMLHLKGGALLYYEDTLVDDADVTLECPKNALIALLGRNMTTVENTIDIQGNKKALKIVVENLNQFTIGAVNNFNIIES
jgi:alkyl sulfatase BDS1-like metallo-beta-lactamase superfamily hydrolase